MKQRTLGSQGLTVSEIGYGAMGNSIAYGATDANEAIETIKKAYDLGVTLFDTAEAYGWGENEKILATATKGFRDRIVLATKFGFTMDGGTDSSPKNIRKVADNSLRYLDTDYIDIFYQHRVDDNIPIEDVAGAVGELIQAGKVKYFGMSEAGPNTIRRAHAVQPVSVLQGEYSLFERNVEQVIPVLDELGIGLVPYSPLGRGFLTGSVKPAADYEANDWRRVDPRWQPENFEKNLAATARLSTLAQSKGITVAQLALAWLLAKGDNIVPIPGTRNLKRLKENVGAAHVVLTSDDLRQIDEILPEGGFGARYPDAYIPQWD